MVGSRRCAPRAACSHATGGALEDLQKYKLPLIIVGVGVAAFVVVFFLLPAEMVPFLYK